MPKLDFAQLLLTTIEKKASDLHLTVGDPPMLRIHGSIQPIDGKPASLTPEGSSASLQVLNVPSVSFTYLVQARLPLVPYGSKVTTQQNSL
jgi:Tfp pilus assembly pilus retraction ATPase PilT